MIGYNMTLFLTNQNAKFQQSIYDDTLKFVDCVRS